MASTYSAEAVAAVADRMEMMNARRRTLRRLTPSRECPVCGNPGADVGSRCQKCGELNVGGPCRPLFVVDVAHAGESWEEAQQKIVKAVDRALAGRHKGVKIVHGHGQASGRGVIRGKAVELLNNLAKRTGGRLRPDGSNPGAHILSFAD